MYEKGILCLSLDISKKYYSHWATGFRTPKFSNIKKIIKWAKKNTPHDIPTIEHLMGIEKEKRDQIDESIKSNK